MIDRPRLELIGVRLRLWPILLAFVVMQLCLVPARELARWLFFRAFPADWSDDVGMFVWFALMLQGLVGLLVALTPGRVRLGRLELPIAGVIVAVLFGLAHYESFIYHPLHMAIAQQLYAFAWGLIYVWLMERSQSLLAPIVAHGVGNFVEVAATMGLMHAWS